MLKKTELDILKTYQKNNPSFYYKTNRKNIDKLKKKIEDFYFFKLKFPLENFQDKNLIEFGCGSGQRSLIYNLWAKKTVHVDFDEKSIKNAKDLFKKFSTKKNFKFFENSIEKFSHKDKFDIVLSEGVIHHHNDPYSQFKKCQKFLKKDGYFVLGIANDSGCFQRMLARQTLYLLSKNENEVIKNSKIIFSEFLKRSHKYSGRKIDDIIADIFLVPTWKPISTQVIEKWFKKNNLKFFNSYPNFIKDSYFADSHNSPVIDRYSNFTLLSELVWMVHKDKDTKFINFYINKNRNLAKSLKKLVKHTNGANFWSKIDINQFLNDTKNFKKCFQNSNLELIEFFEINKFFQELENFLKILKQKDIYSVKKFINNCRFLFKGTYGVGINYYVGKKTSEKL